MRGSQYLRLLVANAPTIGTLRVCSQCAGRKRFVASAAPAALAGRFNRGSRQFRSCMSAHASLLSTESERYVRAILGQQTPFELSAPNGASTLDALLRADSLWNLGHGAEHVAAAVRKSRERPDFCPEQHDDFAAGIEALANGNLDEAYAAFLRACRVPGGILSVFYGERAVNIAFWLACSGKMLDAGNVAAAAVGDVAATPFVAGVLAFAQHINGRSEEAEALALSAVRRGFNDPWTLHAVAHCLYSLGRSRECVAWLQDRRPEVLAATPSPFMKGHMEFHLALCLLDLDDGPALHGLVRGGLWGDLDGSERADYWNAAGLLAVLWKAELRGVCSTGCAGSGLGGSDLPLRECATQALALLEEAAPSKSAVFSLCILRWQICLGMSPTGSRAGATFSAALRNSSNPVLVAVASAMDTVYAGAGASVRVSASSDAGFDSIRSDPDGERGAWVEAARLLAPVADQLSKLGASPEQREVIEEFVGVVAARTSECNIIDFGQWEQRNRRPNVLFYDRLRLPGDSAGSAVGGAGTD